MVEDCADDNIVYLEIRTTPKARKDMTKEDYLQAVLKVRASLWSHTNPPRPELPPPHGHSYSDILIIAFKLVQGIQQASSCPSRIHVRVLLSINRASDSLEEAMDTARLARRYMDRGVVGLDLSGDPSKGAHPLHSLGASDTRVCC